ncbi:MAG: cysteine desulfurase [Defluviitaleaceae bacterium]|nr:cysteine desulfurase [Defluviitaleaceae bacterium]MCL2835675.1 cysteine desulfurase [Defluviitaleaceae bacterium]
MIYFDNAASSKVSRAAREASAEVMDSAGNPSAGHYRGRLAKGRLRDARAAVAGLLNAPENDVYFTSGGTESNCLAVLGAVKRPGVCAVTSKAEHPSVISCFKEIAARGAETVFLQPDSEGRIDTGQLKSAINDRTVLASLMHVNHETGVIADIEGFSRVIKSCGKDILFHVDAVQGFGKHPVDVRKWNADMVSVSAHKIHGVSGTGALYVKAGVLGKLRPIMYGGGQERGIRPGTENLAGICAFGVSAAEAGKELNENLNHVSAIKERLLRIPLEIAGAVINGGGSVSPYIINVSFPGINSEVLQSALDARNIYVSAGAACNTSKKTPENVVFAYGLGIARAESAIRISLCKYNTVDDAERLIAALKELTPGLRLR